MIAADTVEAHLGWGPEGRRLKELILRAYGSWRWVPVLCG